MKNKKIFISIITLFLILALSINIYAITLDDAKKQMNDANKLDSTQGKSTGVMAVINDVIGLLQLAGTGISVVTITLLGAKYMLSSVEQKAEIKNRAMPVVIGCVILFGAVNLVAIVANFTNAVLK
jgi:type IV secretory pathway VirB2 component (pilin)